MLAATQAGSRGPLVASILCRATSNAPLCNGGSRHTKSTRRQGSGHPGGEPKKNQNFKYHFHIPLSHTTAKINQKVVPFPVNVEPCNGDADGVSRSRQYLASISPVARTRRTRRRRRSHRSHRHTRQRLVRQGQRPGVKVCSVLFLNLDRTRHPPAQPHTLLSRCVKV
jgi:hypothetical protein